MKLSQIHDEFFGNDPEKRYIEDDYIRCLLDIIQWNVLETYMNELKNRVSNFHSPNQTSYINEGDLYFLELMATPLMDGIMINFRSLLKDDEKRSCGKFIKESINLDNDDEDKKSKDFMSAANALHDEIKTTYYPLIKEYEKLRFHKDCKAERYSIKQNTKEYNDGFISIIENIRHDNAYFDIKKFSEIMNKIAIFIIKYYELSRDSSALFRRDFDPMYCDIKTCINKTFDIFRGFISDEIREKNYRETVENLRDSINFVNPGEINE